MDEKNGKGNVHVLLDSNDTWKITREGSKRVIARFENKQEAIARAKEISLNSKSELFVHKIDGTVLWRDTHGLDLYPSLG